MFNFNLSLAFIIFGFSVPGVLIATSGTVRSLETTLKDKLPPGKELPSKLVLTILSTIQTFFLVAVFAIIGAIVTPKIGLSAPFFTALSQGKGFWEVLQVQIVPSLIYGIGGAVIFVLAYYVYYRPRLDPQTLHSMEGLRMQLGMFARILYGGVVEEILTRWGLLSLLIWLGQLIFGVNNALSFWVSAVIAGVLFGLGHLPSYLGAGCKKSSIFLSLMIVMNLWASLVFSYLFLQYGLAAAMFGHMLFHLVWYPFDLYHTSKSETLTN